MPDPVSPQSAFACALQEMPGIGRVTAGRILRHFATYDELSRYPHEQILLRLKGSPNAEALAAGLLNRDDMHARIANATEHLHTLAAQGVEALCILDERVHTKLIDLPRGLRPALLYTYGPRLALKQRMCALFARPPLSESAFELAQDLARVPATEPFVVATGAATGFDAAIHRVTAGASPSAPSVMIAACGLSRIARPMRPAASAVVRAGGLLISSFDMNHGPFEHDDKERALVQAALSDASVFIEPRPATPEWEAMTWALDNNRAVFGVAAPDSPLPGRIHPVQTAVDFEWIIAALRHT